jgi:2-dehydro-3-deoxy-D-arabinonate dehydratase
VTIALYRVALPDGTERLARGSIEEGPRDLLELAISLEALLGPGAGTLGEVLRGAARVAACPADARVLAPIGGQEVWCAGVTYGRSRDARMEESAEPSVYDRVYDAARPELFFKAVGWRVRGPGESIAVRGDSGWDMAEPELGLVLASDRGVAGYVIGNDMSSRTIEGENPLYLPQAKVYDHACALGPAIVPADEVEDPVFTVRMVLRRDANTIFDDTTTTARLRRSFSDLAEHLYRALVFPVGAILLTGTGIVPDAEVTLRAGDHVRIEMGVLGVLENPVVGVG